MNINPELIQLAQWRLTQIEKQAFVPPGAGDPSQGGGDPSQAQGPVDPNGPPVDPSQGAAPPMGGGPGGAAPMPGGGGMTNDTIQQVVQQVMQQMGGGAGVAGGAGGGMGGKPAKADINTVAIDIFQVKKMLQYLFNSMGIPLPPDILDGPNRDPSTGAMMPPGAPGSTSDPAVTAQNAQQQGGQQQPGGQAGGPIPPIQPMEGAGASPGGAAKQGEDQSLFMGTRHTDGFDATFFNKASALSTLYNRLKNS